MPARVNPVLTDDRLNELLLGIDKPGRYTGGELNSIVKPGPMRARLGLMFPDVYEVADGFVVVVELAGVDEKHLSITLDNGRLRITGSRPLPDVGEGKQPLQLEIEQGPFERQIALPADTDAEGVKARFKSGLLIIHIPLRARERSVKVPIREEP